jgi:hypothetical protein
MLLWLGVGPTVAVLSLGALGRLYQNAQVFLEETLRPL